MLTERLKAFQTHLFSLPEDQKGAFERVAASSSDLVAAMNGLARVLGEAPGLKPLSKAIAQRAETLAREIEEDRGGMAQFRVVIYGKVNSGKSYLANLLAGVGLPPASGAPKPAFKAWNPEAGEFKIEGFEVRATECTRQIQWCDLGGLRLVDLPGLDSLTPENHAKAREYVGRADLVLYLTNSDAALRGSDYRHMLGLSQKRKRMIVAISQCDERAGYNSDERLRLGPAKVAEQVTFVRQVFKDPKGGLSEALPGLEIVPVSALLARIGIERSKRHPGEGEKLEQASGIGDLLEAILDIVRTEGAPLRLLSPLDRTLEVLSGIYKDLQKLAAGLRSAEKFLAYKKGQAAKFASRTEAACLEEAYPITDLLAGIRPRLDRFLDYALSLDGFLAHLAGKEAQGASEADKRKTLSRRFQREVTSSEEAVKRAERFQEKVQALVEKKLALFAEDYEAGAKRASEQPQSEILADLWERWIKEEAKGPVPLKAGTFSGPIGAAGEKLEEELIRAILPGEGKKPDKRMVKSEAQRWLKGTEEEVKKALTEQVKGYLKGSFGRFEEGWLDSRLGVIQVLASEVAKAQARLLEIRKNLEDSREAIRERYRPANPEMVAVPSPKSPETALSRG